MGNGDSCGIHFRKSRIIMGLNVGRGGLRGLGMQNQNRILQISLGYARDYCVSQEQCMMIVLFWLLESSGRQICKPLTRSFLVSMLAPIKALGPNGPALQSRLASRKSPNRRKASQQRGMMGHVTAVLIARHSKASVCRPLKLVKSYPPHISVSFVDLFL